MAQCTYFSWLSKEEAPNIECNRHAMCVALHGFFVFFASRRINLIISVNSPI